MIRDEKTKALINPDLESFNKYKVEREKVREIKNMKMEIEILKEQVKNLYQLLQEKN